MASTKPDSGGGPRGAVRYPAGQRLHCKNCGAEVTIISPCGCNPPDMVLRCCAQDMTAETREEADRGAG